MIAPQSAKLDLTATDFGLGDLAAHVAHLLGPSWHHSDRGNFPTLHHADGTRAAFEPALSADPDVHLLLLRMTAGDVCETGEVYVHDEDEDETLSEVGARTAAKIRELCAEQG
ncbi:hypothetical protein OG871_40615 (plasmid) [Kitasatospora sp. NBC_00374]|uniref:hypothetical protein n=1 Tax=Kitasatospora sp. NBC_00374 TaxID=2975964 RepID=UPI002F91521C